VSRCAVSDTKRGGVPFSGPKGPWNHHGGHRWWDGDTTKCN
jgi:hypothetical protein